MALNFAESFMSLALCNGRKWEVRVPLIVLVGLSFQCMVQIDRCDSIEFAGSRPPYRVSFVQFYLLFVAKITVQTMFVSA